MGIELLYLILGGAIGGLLMAGFGTADTGAESDDTALPDEARETASLGSLLVEDSTEDTEIAAVQEAPAPAALRSLTLDADRIDPAAPEEILMENEGDSLHLEIDPDLPGDLRLNPFQEVVWRGASDTVSRVGYEVLLDAPDGEAPQPILRIVLGHSSYSGAFEPNPAPQITANREIT